MTTPDAFHGFYIAENLLLYPDQLAIIKLTYPRLFLRFDYGESYFASYEEFINSIAVQEWLDGEKPDAHEIDQILTDCWNFLALHEREEERIVNETEDEEDF